MRKRKVAIVGNCQASAIAGVYRDFVAALAGDEVIYFNDHGMPPAEVRAGVEGADLIVVQERDFDHGLNPGDVPAGVEVLPFPMVLAGYIWPYANEPHLHNVAEPPFTDGPYPSQLSDSFLNRLIRKDVPPAEAVQQYLAHDIARAANLDRVFEIYMDRQRDRDAKTGFDLAPFIEARFRQEALFRTPHHPNVPLFAQIIDQLFTKLNVPAETIRAAIASLRNSPFPHDELPIHPGVIRHFGLGFADENTRYQYFHEGRFTFAEYADRYMRYESNHDLRLGVFMSIGGDPDEALARLTSGLERSPGSPGGLRAKGLVLTRLGRYDEAAAVLAEAIAAEPDNPEGPILLARARLDGGDGPAAVAAAEQAIALAPGYAQAHETLADIHLRAGNGPAALAPAREAARLMPGRGVYRAMTGAALSLSRDLDAAEAEARAALAMEPEHPDRYNLLAEIHEEQGRRADAIAVLEQGLAQDIGNAQTFSLLGNFHVRDRNLAKAEAAFARGVGLDPGRPDLESCWRSVREERELLGESVGPGPSEMGAAAKLAPKPEKPAPPPGPLDLYWLPPPEDWRGRIKALESRAPGDAEAWPELVALANTRLDFLKTGRLDRALLRLFGDAPPPGLATRPVKLAILGSSTTDHLHAGIRIAALRRGLWVTLYEPDYGQYRQALADPSSGLHAFAPDAILFALDAPHLLRRADAALDEAGAQAALDETVEELKGLWRMARGLAKGSILQQTVLPVFPALLGQNEDRLPGSPAAMTAALNHALRIAAREEGVDLLALDTRAAEQGVALWHDPVLWLRAKQEVSPLAAGLYGEMVARLLAAGQGRSAKALVLDLDNTVWGGVIGDDGLEGIALGQGSALGEAFAGFQAYAKALAKRGVILAACSKNDEANAIEAFEKHPEMVLKRGDISAFVANWNDKASNLRAIAETLNIGLDALVFADDNPFERNLIRRELPMVSVPELPEDPALYARAIADAGYFESLAVTADDRARTEQYRANQERTALAASTTDMAAYLRSLDMQLVWRPFDRTGLARVTQLINKSNQFNLTTIRYTEEEVAAVMDDPAAFGLQLRLTDRFGDNGIIAVVIGRLTDPATVEIDTWLMSCRVLGRRVEQATLALIVGEARRLGALALVGRYRRTPKNNMVADHYPKLGFVCVEQGPDAGLYSLDLAAYEAPDLPMAIVKD